MAKSIKYEITPSYRKCEECGELKWIGINCKSPINGHCENYRWPVTSTDIHKFEEMLKAKKN